MYISPFWCGVIATVVTEVIVLIILGTFSSGNKEDETNDK